ncbi:MAG: exodeoxyribonuclease VII large subunit [Phycisphaerae bacterium]|nr:exodeoxyribonuclease VII large subunit [Phycisphaerae bacterium]
MALLPFDIKDATEPTPEPVSVSEVSHLIVEALSRGLPATIRVRGELSGFTVRNGHWFFSLRDQTSSLDGVMWASQARSNQHTPEEGEQVLITGRVGHWPRGGRTRLEARRLEPDGAGDLRAAFLKLCKELRSLGWFSDDIKKPLPAWPRHIGVVTSAKGAALTDVIATARSRFPATSLLIVDVRVQGDAAAAEVVTAIKRLDESAARLGLDALLVTRGGGAAEDLEAFNDRRVAQAVHEARTPVVAAIGHESDTTIIELVADARASTPTQAMTILLPDREDVLERFDSFGHRLHQAGVQILRIRHGRIDPLEERLVRGSSVRIQQDRLRVKALESRLSAARPDRQIKARRAQLEMFEARLHRVARRFVLDRPQPKDLMHRLNRAVAQCLRHESQRVRTLDRAMLAVDPMAVLQRGYSMTVDEHGRTVRDASSVEPGDQLVTRIARGSIRSSVDSTEAAGTDSDTVGS